MEKAKTVAYRCDGKTYHLCKAARVALTRDGGNEWRLGTVTKMTADGAVVLLDEKLATAAGRVVIHFADLATSEDTLLLPVTLMGANFNPVTERKVRDHAYTSSNPIRPMLKDTSPFLLTNSSAVAIYRLVCLWCFDGKLPLAFPVVTDKLLDKVRIPSNFGELQSSRRVSVTPTSEETVAITPQLMVIRKNGNYTLKQAVEVIAHECCHLWVSLHDVKTLGAHAVWLDGKDTQGHGDLFMAQAPKLARYGINLSRYGEITVPLGGVGGTAYYVISDRRNVDGVVVSTLRMCSSNFEREIDHLNNDDKTVNWWIVESNDKNLRTYVTGTPNSNLAITKDSKLSIMLHSGRVIASSMPTPLDNDAETGVTGFKPGWQQRSHEEREQRKQQEAERRKQVLGQTIEELRSGRENTPATKPAQSGRRVRPQRAAEDAAPYVHGSDEANA